MKKLLFLLILMGVHVNAQIVNIPDANFKAKLLSASPSNQIASTQTPNVNGFVSTYSVIDSNGDGEVQVNEALAIKYLNLFDSNAVVFISDLTGIQYFTNLEYLKVTNNNITSLNVNLLYNLKHLICDVNQILNLNVSGLSNLRVLNCDHNQLSNLNLSGLLNLEKLVCSQNQLLNLDFSGLTNLKQISCAVNQLSNINLSGLSNLTNLGCGYNSISSLNLLDVPLLQILSCDNNQITSLNVSHLSHLNTLMCTENQLTTLDVSNLSQLNLLGVHSNNLNTLNMKNNNSFWFEFGFSNNPNLQYICANEVDIPSIQQQINENGLTNCHVNSYCSFTPGGTFYTINGTNHYDENNNGCDAGDILYPNLKLNITNGTFSGSFIGNTNGDYSIPVQAGTHTLAPQLENPSYFNVSPATTSVTFPTQASPFTQDYCMTANGTHHDLEVTIIPINVARPGFDANYKIIYKNKGTNTETATLNFNYDDAVLDFVSATTTPTTQNGGNLVWSLGTIQPLQSGEIMLTLNLNTPTETPPLNAGDVLNYSAIINGAFADETPVDNTFNLPQSVVNSFDPNDKTCLEGETISNSMIGQYVHYMIRFENTGTYPAQNIVVKDMIDTTKFDISTIQMTRASHDCYTRINGNKVEFIFENINLPFDDATNDGYVVFKIKTLPTLAQNSSVSNTADIFFDYNFPITTNTATTNFANLATQNAEKVKVSVYPNPAKNLVNIKSENQINSVTVFDIQGRQVQTKIVGATETTIEISNLQQGNYLLKINTDKGVVSEKIIKE